MTNKPNIWLYMENYSLDITDTIKKQLFNSLKIGTGEAYLILKHHPTIDFSELIIKAAIKNFTYHKQSYNHRVSYIYKLVKQCKQTDKIIKAVLLRLQSKKKDYWSLEQMCDLAVLFFKAGYPEAKIALYNRVKKNNLKGYESCGKSQLMAIDGLNGFLTVAECIGKNPIINNTWETNWVLEEFQKNNKHLSVYTELEQASKNNAYIRAYYQSIRHHTKTVINKPRSTRFTDTWIKNKIHSNTLLAVTPLMAKKLSIKAVENLAKELLIEQNKQKQWLYMRLFAKRPFPFDYQPILKIARAKHSRHSNAIRFCIDALHYFSGQDIRDFALMKLSAKKIPKSYIAYLALLVNNYQVGDSQLLIKLINTSDHYDLIHSITLKVLAIYEVNSTKECQAPLEMLYKKTNCDECRHHIVKLLFKNYSLNDTIKQEIKFDSHQDLRKFYKLII